MIEQPKSIRIRGIDHPVIKFNPLTKGDLDNYVFDEGEHPEDTIWGSASAEKCEIRLNDRVILPMQVITLWHEIAHLTLCHSSYPMSSHDESMIDALAYGLVEVIRDNPDLIQYTIESAGKR